MTKGRDNEGEMDKIASVKAADIAPEAKQWLSGLLQVEVKDSDEFTFTLHRTAEEEGARRRAAARERLLALFARTDQRSQRASDKELDAAIDEALRFVRSRSGD